MRCERCSNEADQLYWNDGKWACANCTEKLPKFRFNAAGELERYA